MYLPAFDVELWSLRGYISTISVLGGFPLTLVPCVGLIEGYHLHGKTRLFLPDSSEIIIAYFVIVSKCL